MASEIQIPYSATAATLYAIVRNSVGQVWQTTTSTFVSYATANIGNYDIPLTEQGTASRFYEADFPEAAAGSYGVSVYAQAGGSPAEGDTLAGAGNIEWDGMAVIPLNSRLPTTSYVTPPTVGQIDTQLSGTHGSGSWVDVGGGTGARTRTVTVTDDNATPLEGATVRLTNGITTASDQTDASGVAYLFVDDATWDLAVTKDGYEPDSGQPETVAVTTNGNTAYVLVANVIPSPASPSRATVYADFARILPTLPPNKIDVRFTLIMDDAVLNDAGDILADRVFTTRPDADGRLEIELDRTDLMTPTGAQWRVECPTANLDATFDLEAATFDLATLIT